MTRMEVTSLGFYNIDRISDPDPEYEAFIQEVSPSDIQGSCRILISDGDLVHEIYNPEKLKSFNFVDFPSGFQNCARRRKLENAIIHTDFPLLKTGQYQEEEEELQDSGSCPKPQPQWFVGWLYSGSSLNGGPNDLPVMGPRLDIQPVRDYFVLIVHQDTMDEELLVKWFMEMRIS